MTDPMTTVTVEQRHRDAAAPLIEMAGWQELADLIRAGDRDANPMVQAFVRFDTERTAELERQNAALREAERHIRALLDHKRGIDGHHINLLAEEFLARNALGDQP